MKCRGKIIAVQGNLVKIEVDTLGLKIGQKFVLSTGESRSSLQNALYWKMLEIVSDETGYTKDELHEFFRHEFLGDKIQIMDKPFVFPRSTTKLKTDEFGKYLTDIRFYVLDKLGLNLPID